MRRAVASALLATGLAAALVACQGRPADSVALSLYHRNLSDEPFTYRILGTLPGNEEWIGLVPDGATSSGCGYVGLDWELLVTAGERAAEPGDEVVASLSAEDAGNPATVAVAFTIAPDGTVVIGGGVPAWWDADVQTCPGA